VPGIAAAVVVAGFAVQPLLASADAGDLPAISADQLLVEVLEAEPQPLSGTVVYTADLGLPDLSEITKAVSGPALTADPANLLAGTSTLRVWTDADARSRVTLQGTTSEFSVVHDRTQAWTYSSADGAVVHYALSETDQARVAQLQALVEAGAFTVPGGMPTPTTVADDLLAQVGEHSTLSLDANVKVAGRSAYQLVLTPTSTTTLVGRVTVAVDAQTRTPLQVAVWSRADTQSPALQVGFTDVRFAMPSEQVLTWSTPAGATVKEVTIPLPSDTELAGAEHAAPAVSVTGTGWDQVLTLTVPAGALDAQDLTALATAPGIMPEKAQEYAQIAQGPHGAAVDPSALLDQLSTPVAGGRVISSALLSVLLLDDGRVLLGAVPPATLVNLAG